MLETTRFVAACCSWPHDDAAQRRVAQIAGRIDNWDQIREIVEHHRVVPLVYLAIKDLTIVPKDFIEWARHRALATAHHCMQMTQECMQLDAKFRAAGLLPLHFKGPTLAQIAYGNVALKYNNDLDIFIKETDVKAAILILEAENYRAFTQKTPVTDRQLAALKHNFKDLCFIGPKGQLVEIHWRFTSAKSALSGLENNLQRSQVSIAGKADLDTFNSEQMLTYLSVHGAGHHWTRLKWLADLSAYLNQIPEDERDIVVSKVINGPAGNAFAQALSLCDTLFETKHAPKLDHRTQTLYEYALSQIDQTFYSQDRVKQDFDFVRNVLAMRNLYSGFWAAVWSLKSHLICQVDVLAFPLPRYLNGLYPLIRGPSFLMRRLRSR